MDKSRFFENTFPEYDGTTELLGTDAQLVGKISDDIKAFITSRLHEVQNVYEAHIQKKTFDSSHDSTVYTGTSGIVLLSQKISTSENPEWNSTLAFSESLRVKAVPRRKRITFLCGDAGILALGATHCNNKGDDVGRKKFMDELIQLASWSSEKKLDNEVLYGRAGYLYALLYIKQYVKDTLVPDAVISQIVNDLINIGLKSRSHSSALSLHYVWHDKEYIGAAHGYVGIFYMLLQAKLICPGSWKESHNEVIISCLDGLLKQRFSSGNLRSSMGSESDRLIHWCHGAPGAVHLYALAYKVFKNPSYLSAARGFADNIWYRGLLRKGYGICHGVAGNGYAFLCMFQLTGETQYLWKAIKFAEWCLLYGQHGCNTPDAPFSLFEGLAGTIYFMHDILRPKNAMFPAFQLLPYT